MIGNNHSSCFFVIFLSLVLTSFFAKSMTFRHIFAAHEGSHTTIGNGFGDASENERSSNIPIGCVVKMWFYTDLEKRCSEEQWREILTNLT